MNSEHHHKHKKNDFGDASYLKRKLLREAELRRKLVRFSYVLLCIVAAFVVAACVYVYFFDGLS